MLSGTFDHQLSCGGQYVVAFKMPVTVVVCFEIVDIKEQQGEWSVLSFCTFNLSFKSVIEITLIVQASQAIFDRHFFEFKFQSLLLCYVLADGEEGGGLAVRDLYSGDGHVDVNLGGIFVCEFGFVILQGLVIVQ